MLIYADEIWGIIYISNVIPRSEATRDLIPLRLAR